MKPRPRRSSRGSLLIVTLWLIGVLAMLSLALSHGLSIELRLVRYRIGKAQASALARGGVRYGQALLVAELPTEAYDWLGDEWALDPGAERDLARDPRTVVLRVPVRPGAAEEAQITVAITDEERKLNLNVAESVQLVGLGLPAAVAQALVDYHDPPDPNLEDEPYGDPPYVAKNDKIVALEELWDVPALEQQPQLRILLANAGTVWTNGRVNINTASYEVLRALGMDPSLATMVMQFRGDPMDRHELGYFFDQGGQLQSSRPFEGIDALRAFALTQPQGIGVQSQVFQIVATGTIAATGMSEQIVAIVDRSRAAGQQAVLAWREG